MAGSNSIGGILETALEKIKEVSSSDTIIGTPVSVGEGVTVVPISKITFGFGGGGSDFGKPDNDKFGVGTGGGMTVTPIAILLSEPKRVRLLQLSEQKGSSVVDSLIKTAPDLIDKVKELFAKKEDKDE